MCGSQQTWKILTEIGMPDHITCLLRILYADQEATVRTGHGTMDWFQIGKGVQQGCILSPCLTSIQSTSCEMLGWMNHKLESQDYREKHQEPQICRWCHSNGRKSEEKLKSFLMRVKEESENVGFKLNLKKTKIMASGPITSRQINGGKVEQWQMFYFLGLPKSHCGWWLQPWN